MTTHSTSPPRGDCWNVIGIRGDRSCPELETVVHCYNCPVFTAAGRQFLDGPSPPGYVDEWTERLAAPLEQPASDLQCGLIFRLGDEWLALGVDALVEVTNAVPVHHVPFRAGLLAGLVNIRGELHLCARIDALLGIAPAAEVPATPAMRRMVVVRREEESWVFAVDEVGQVHRFPTSELRDVPVTVALAGSRLTRGVLEWHGRSVGVLDSGRLFEALRTRVR